jgi:hypothetical protein
MKILFSMMIVSLAGITVANAAGLEGKFVLAKGVQLSPTRMRYTQAFPEGNVLVSFDTQPCSQDFRRFIDIGGKGADGKEHYRIGVIVYDTGEKCAGAIVRKTKNYGILGSYGPGQINESSDVQPLKLLSNTTAQERQGHEDFYLGDVQLGAASVPANNQHMLEIPLALTLQPCAQKLEYLLVADGSYDPTLGYASGSSTSHAEGTHMKSIDGSRHMRIGAVVRDSGEQCEGAIETQEQLIKHPSTNADFFFKEMTFGPLAE